MFGFWRYFNIAPFTETISDEGAYPFIVEDGVNYSFEETLNCQFVIAGSVELLDKNTIDPENIVIMVQPLATYDDRPTSTISIGSDTRFGEGGWSQLLVGNYWNVVWVHDLSLDIKLSEEILVDDLDCASERILATVNFRQIRLQ